MISPRGSLRGADRPRVEVRPDDAVDSYGDIAVELGTRAGLNIEAWQHEGLQIILSVREDGLWAARHYMEVLGRQQGKSIGLGIPRALTGLFVLGERLIIWSSHEYKTSMETFLQARDAIYRLGEEAGQNLVAIEAEDAEDGYFLVKIHNTNGEEQFERLDTGQRWRFVARSKGSGRGFSGDCNIVDEAFAYTRVQQRALAPTLLARPNPQTIHLSSPPLDADSGDVMFGLAKRAASGKARRLGYRDWGLAITRDELDRMKPEERTAFLNDHRNWARALPALGKGRVTVQAVQDLREELDDDGFASEVLCMWPERSEDAARWQVISERAWRARATATERPDGPLAFAIAASFPDAARVAVDVAGRRGRELVVQIARHDVGTSWVVGEVQRLRDTWRPFAVVLDPKGPAGVLQAPLEKAGIELVLVGANEAAAAAATLYDAVAGDAPYLAHFGEGDLDTAVATADKRPLGDAYRFRRSATSAPLEAAALAAWAVVARERRPPSPPRAIPALTGGGPETADLDRIGF